MKFIPLVRVSFHQSCGGLDGMYVIDNVSCQVLFEQRMFPLIFISMIQQIFCLSPLLLMGIWCQIVPLWIPFAQSYFSLRLQPHSGIKLVTSKIWFLIIPFTVVIRPSLYYMFTNDLMFSLIDSFLTYGKHLSPREPINQEEFFALSESK